MAVKISRAMRLLIGSIVLGVSLFLMKLMGDFMNLDDKNLMSYKAWLAALVSFWIVLPMKAGRYFMEGYTGDGNDDEDDNVADDAMELTNKGMAQKMVGNLF